MKYLTNTFDSLKNIYSECGIVRIDVASKYTVTEYAKTNKFGCLLKTIEEVKEVAKILDLHHYAGFVIDDEVKLREGDEVYVVTTTAENNPRVWVIKILA